MARVSNVKKPAKSPSEVEKTCIAKRAGACNREGDCLECSPVEQSLRTAGWALSRWPHVGKRGGKT